MSQPGDVTVIATLSIQNGADAPIMRAADASDGWINTESHTTRDALLSAITTLGTLVRTLDDGVVWEVTSVGPVVFTAWSGAGGVTSFNGRDHAVVPVAGDYAASQVVNDSATVPGAHVSDALDALEGEIGLALPSNTAAALVPAWYVNSATGSDANDGKSAGTAFATTLKLQNTLCPGGTTCVFQQSTNIYLAGTLGNLTLAVEFPVGASYVLDIGGAYTSSAPFTLGTVVDTNPAGPTRGRITAAGATFTDKCRIRVVSGAYAGAITYCTGVNSSTDAWVKAWSLGTASTTNIPAGTSCVIDTLTTTVGSVTLQRPTYFRSNVHDLVLSAGYRALGYPTGSTLATVVGCQFTSVGGYYGYVTGNVHVEACVFASGFAVFSEAPQPIFRGCLFLGSLGLSGSMAAVPSFQGNGNCFYGGYLLVGNGGTTGAPEMLGIMGATEWTNGAGLTAITIDRGLLVIGAQMFGFGTPYDVGVSMTAESHAVAGSASQLAIPATQQMQMVGRNLTYSQIPIAYPRSACTFALTSDTTSPSTADPILASQVTNDSATVTGAKVSNALDALKAAITSIVAGVSSYKGRVGAVNPAANDYAASQVGNDSSVSGTFVKDALNTLGTGLAGLVTGVSSVYGRAGAVVALAGDYAASKITNDSSVTGTYVKDALNALQAAIAASVTGVSSVYGRTGTVIAAASDYAASQIANDSSVAGSYVKDALNTLKTNISGLVVGVSSVYGRAGAVVAVAGDYAASKITNDSSVSGAHVSDALNALKAAIAATGVTSVFGRLGVVVAAAGDYAASQITNDSTVIGTGVSGALNTLKGQIAALVVGVSSYKGRVGAVMPASADYPASFITNDSVYVAGTTAADALDTLTLEFLGSRTVYTHTLALADVRWLLTISGDHGTATITLPPHTTTAFRIGARIGLMILDPTPVSLDATGVTLLENTGGPLLRPNVLHSLTYVAVDTWVLTTAVASWTSDDVNNTSSIHGPPNVSGALNSLQTDISGLTTTQIHNSSSVPGTTATDVLNYLQNQVLTTYSLPLINVNTAYTISGAWVFYGYSSWYGSARRGGLCFMLGPLPIGRGVTAITAYYAPPSRSALPPSLPQLALVAGNNGSAAPATTVALKNDPSTTAAEYNAPHSLTLPGTFSTGSPMWIFFYDEDSEGADIGGLSLYQITYRLV